MSGETLARVALAPATEEEVAERAIDTPERARDAPERAREAALELELEKLMRERPKKWGGAWGGAFGGAWGGAWGGTWGGAWGEAPEALQPRDATKVLPLLIGALSEDHPRDVAFLDDFWRMLTERTRHKAQVVTAKVMRSAEDSLSAAAGSVGAAVLASWLGAEGAVLACWLGAAIVWTDPHVPGAPTALRSLLRHLTPDQVLEVARALYAALRSRELIDVSDAVRGATNEEGRSAGLTELLHRAALAKLLSLEPEWRVEALGAGELREALVERWAALGGPSRLSAVALAERVLANGAPPGETAALLGVLEPSLEDRHDTYYQKVCAALKTVQRRFLNQ